MKAKYIARCGMLTALMLVLGYIEHLLPLSSALPGVKIGLSNTVLLYALYLLDTKTAVALAFLKVTLSALLFSSPFALLYSASGAALSLMAMALVKRGVSASPIGVSVAGALAHNIGQCAAASFVIGVRAVAIYLPVLLLSGALTGILTGTVAVCLIKYIKK